MEDKQRGTTTLKTLDNALSVLAEFTLETPTWGLRELSKKMDMNHTVLHRILKTFEEWGYLRQNPLTKEYELGLKILEFTSVVKQRMKLSEFVVPVMHELVDEVGETAFLTLRDGDKGVTVEIVECERPIKFNVSIGTRTPLHAGASCKVILAFMDREEQINILPESLQAFTSKTVTERDALLRDLDAIRDSGVCVTKGEFSEAVLGIAVPLFNTRRDVVGSLTIAGPVYRMPDEIVQEHAEKVLNKGRVIQQYMDRFGSFY
ncbi:transcriptional regulator, IclR family [Bhargavaea beijingensis]|uniref:Transcriptional regulator, IclR family n=1 Tax=Bhargavaea beijingensis TaxID=426756 RepID=A0A1G7H9L6_9BACL|nr:IclR family transcriptional regulator [Bhargavaea beijingensis]SDE97118.1 transcriptional regulator, IclR family [Bhargavaea beijingensis]